MAKLIILDTFSGERGNLTVLEKVFPKPFKRIFYIYGVDNSERGGHRHHKTWQALICLAGSCRISNNDGEKKEVFSLDNPTKCLILEPKDWHILDQFSKDSILLVLASEYYDEADYIFEKYR